MERPWLCLFTLAAVMMPLPHLTAQAGPPRIPRQTQVTTAAVQGLIHMENGLGLSGAQIVLRHQTTGNEINITATGDGVFLQPDLAPGTYRMTASKEGFAAMEPLDIETKAG